MKYTKMFSTSKSGINENYNRSGPARLADRTKNPVYEYTPEIELAINVALATGRPLLVRGPSGSGKSSLARSVAHRLKWRYYETVVTTRTKAQDLLWIFDNIRRLNDAQSKEPLKEAKHYIKPGILWWAFNRNSAGMFDKQEPLSPQPNSEDTVILIDEIDKAEPDVPNNLLIPIGSLEFYIDEIDQIISASPEHPPLIFITTNDERQLPMAFLRRCLLLKLNPPSPERLIKIAEQHFGKRDDSLYSMLAEQITQAVKNKERPEANAAEYLDAVWACISLNVKPPNEGEEPSPTWLAIRESTLLKPASVQHIKI